MKKITSQTLLKAATAPAVLGFALLSSAAYAQDPQGAAEADGEEAIVVTGSRIQRVDLETSSPVSVIGSEEIAYRAPNSAEDLIRDLPAVRPSLGPGVNNGSDGSSSVNLRGLGDNRTLVILDGRRIVPFGLDNIVDLNVIPVGLVERVDVVTGGASSVYGADAVAGVVNFITKRNFSGIEASTNYRISQQGDARQFRADVLIGANLDDGRGNVVLGISYGERDALLHTQRGISQLPISPATGLFVGSTGAVPSIWQTQLATTANPAGLPNGPNVGSVIDPTTGAFRAATAADTFNTNIGTYFLTPLDRINVYTSGRYEVTDGIEAYATGMFTRNRAELALAASGTFGNSFVLPLNNPYIPTAARNQLCAASGISVADCNAAAAVNVAPGATGSAAYRTINVIPSRRFLEYGARGNPIESTMFQIQAGLRGDITSTLHFDISAQYGETAQNQARDNWGSASKVQQALLSYRNAAGQLVCQNTANGCTPLNLFGALGSITPDMLGFIDLDAQIRRLVQLSVVTGSVSGDLFGITSPLASNPIAFALGAEYRNISARATPDASSQIQGEVLGTGARTPPDFGQYEVREAFGEIIIPLVEDSFIKSATLEAGLRLSDYSTTGSSSTWKAGGSIEPIGGVKIRGMYQVAVRSPNILELYQSAVQALSNQTIDFCQGATPTAPRNLCEYTGAPAGTYGGISAPSSGQINTTTQGNRNLDVERAKTITVGAVFQPSFIPGLSLTVDWFKIRITDLISAPGQNDILNGCYSAALNPSQTPNAFCDLIKRNPLTGSLNGAGETLGVILSSSNLGRMGTSGIDWGFSYRFDLGKILSGDPGTLRISSNGTWLDYFWSQATPNSITRECAATYSTGCTNPRPKWKWNTRVAYSKGPFDISLLWNHISKVRFEPIQPAGLPLTTPQFGSTATAFNGVLPQFRSIPAYDYFDLNLGANIGDNLEVGVLVENLFNKKPPLVGATVGGTAFNSGNTFPTTYDVIGRAYTISAKLKF